MGIVEVVQKAVVHAAKPKRTHWLPFTNLDLLVPPFDVGSIFFYKKPTHGSFPTMVNSLKSSLSQALSLYHPISGGIEWNEAAGETQIHCNDQGVDFIQAAADVKLKELDLYNPDECIENKLMPKKQRGVAAFQVTELNCGGMAIGCMFDHRISDGYSANMFISSWADLARSKPPSMLPSFGRSYLNPRSPTIYSPSIDNVFAPFNPPPNSVNGLNGVDEGDKIVNRIYYIEGEQLKKIQLLASENNGRRSKLVSFTAFMWKNVALSMESLGNCGEACNVVVTVDGRSRLSEGDGEEKEKLMASHFGNVLSMPFGSKKPEELKDMKLSDVATEVNEFLKTATTKEHFLNIIDWVEVQRPRPLISKAFAGGDMSFSVSQGQRFETMDAIDFGWGKVALGSCHSPNERRDSFMMTMGSPVNSEDWVVYTHMPRKHVNYIESNLSHVFKPINADYLKI